MIKIKINTKTYKVPNGFDELSIGKYQEISAIDTDGNQKVIDYISALTNIKIYLIKKLNINDIKKITENFNFFNVNLDEHEIVDVVKIKNRYFVFDRNLNDMRFDMFIDLEEMTKDKDEIINNLHLIMAILYRPALKRKRFRRKLKVEDYDSESVKERSDFFKENLMMDKILGSLFFFINLKTKYIADSVDYLQK